MEKKRGSVWGAVIGAVILVMGAIIGLPRYATAGLVWTIAGAVLLGYNVWALLRQSGKTAPQDFPMPDPEEQEREKNSLKARLNELERQYKNGELGYEEYIRRRMEIIQEL